MEMPRAVLLLAKQLTELRELIAFLKLTVKKATWKRASHALQRYERPGKEIKKGNELGGLVIEIQLEASEN